MAEEINIADAADAAIDAEVAAESVDNPEERPGVPTKTPKQRARAMVIRDRERMAWDLRAAGMTEQKIADRMAEAGLGRITQQAVSATLIRVEARALAELSARVGGLKASQTKSLMYIYGEAMEAWDRSKGATKSVTKRVQSEGEQGSSQPMTVQIRDQDGDPRFLAEARAALADIRKIWGIEVMKIAPTTPDGNESYRPNKEAMLEALRKLPPEDVSQLRALAEKFRALASSAEKPSEN